MGYESVPIVVTTTTPTRAEADGIARALVERRLAACVQILDPIHSRYWWEGTVQEDAEVMLVIKSVDSLFPSIEALLTELHPYEVPELIAVPVVAASEAYLRWLMDSVREPEA